MVPNYRSGGFSNSGSPSRTLADLVRLAFGRKAGDWVAPDAVTVLGVLGPVGAACDIGLPHPISAGTALPLYGFPWLDPAAAAILEYLKHELPGYRFEAPS